MKNEGKKESIWTRIKLFFKHLFKKDKLKELPEKSIVSNDSDYNEKEELNNLYEKLEKQETNINGQINEINNTQNEKQIEEQKYTENIEETNNQEEQINEPKSKEEYLQMYKDVKEKKIDPKSLTENELKVFIQLAKQELNFINKKIDEEITQGNMYRREIAYYKQKIGEVSN